MNAAAKQLAFLGNSMRLSGFLLLVRAVVSGSIIAERLHLAPATLSFHLASLHHAGLPDSRQESRFDYYMVDFTVVDGLLADLVEDCCQGTQRQPKTAVVYAKACC